MMTMTVNLSGNVEISALLDRVRAALVDQEEINAVVAVALDAVVKTHLTENYATKPNWLNAPSTGFWRKAIDTLDTTSSGTVTTTTISGKGVALRYHGGVITPSGRTSEVTGKPIRFLAFPVSADVYGKAIKEVAFKMYPSGKDGPGLYRQDGDEKSESDQKMYAFARRTEHKPDPNILPAEQTTLDAVADALGDLVDSTIET